MITSVFSGNAHSSDEIAEWLESCCTWRQLRSMAKRNKVLQYSYLTKRQLAQVLAIQTHNRLCRK